MAKKKTTKKKTAKAKKKTSKAKKKPARAKRKAATRPRAEAGLPAEVTELVRTQLAVGSSRDELLQMIDDNDGEWPGVTRATATAMIDELIAEARKRQARWPKTTDNDRLERALEDLGAEGILGKQDYWCCMTCALGSIGEDMDEHAASTGKPVEGYAFFHDQDAERAAGGGPLLLAYGAYDGGPRTGEAIGRRVAAALRKRGLETEWNGTFDKRIAVHLQWRRRV